MCPQRSGANWNGGAAAKIFRVVENYFDLPRFHSLFHPCHSVNQIQPWQKCGCGDTPSGDRSLGASRPVSCAVFETSSRGKPPVILLTVIYCCILCSRPTNRVVGLDASTWTQVGLESDFWGLGLGLGLEGQGLGLGLERQGLRTVSRNYLYRCGSKTEAVVVTSLTCRLQIWFSASLIYMM